MAIDRASELPSRRTASLVGGTVLIVILLAGCSWATFARNQVWNSEIRLWEDATLKSPENPTGFIRYANALIAVGATDAAYENLGKASNLTHEDPAGFVALARAFDALGNVADTERSFNSPSHPALTDAPRFPTTLSGSRFRAVSVTPLPWQSTLGIDPRISPRGIR